MALVRHEGELYIGDRRTLSIAACPKCGRRDPSAVQRWWITRSLPVVLTVTGIALLGWLPMLIDIDMKESDKPIAGWVMTGIAIFIAIPFVFTHIVMGWSTAKQGVTFDEPG